MGTREGAPEISPSLKFPQEDGSTVYRSWVCVKICRLGFRFLPAALHSVIRLPQAMSILSPQQADPKQAPGLGSDTLRPTSPRGSCKPQAGEDRPGLPPWRRSIQEVAPLALCGLLPSRGGP